MEPCDRESEYHSPSTIAYYSIPIFAALAIIGITIYSCVTLTEYDFS